MDIGVAMRILALGKSAVNQLSGKNLLIKPLVFSIQIVICSTTLLYAVSASANTDSSIISYSIPNSKLGQALSDFALQAGIKISIDAKQVQGLKSKGLKGQYSIEQGFQKLLEGTKFEATKTINGYILTDKLFTSEKAQVRGMGQLNTIDVQPSQHAKLKNSVTQLPTITVNAEQTGSTEQGYFAKNVTGIGVWQGRSLQNTPYSMNIISKDILENSLVQGIEGIAKLAPTVQVQRPSNESDTQYAAIRGFDLWGNTVIDGINLSMPSYGISYEEIERIEILNGLSGFMYGAGNVGGVMNYVIKRPTYDKLADITIGNYGGQQYFTHLDLGNKIDQDGKFAYRLNIAHQNGDTTLDNQSIKRTLLSGAIDWNVSDQFLVQLEASHRKNLITAPNAAFFFSNTDLKRPTEFKNKKSYTPDWTRNENETNRFGLNLVSQVNDNLSIRAGYKYKEVKDEGNITLFPLVNGDGTYSVYGPYFYAPSNMISHGLYTYIDTNFNTGNIEHKLTFGIASNKFEQEKYQKPLNVIFNLDNKYTLDELNYITKTDLSQFEYGKQYTSAESELRTITIGDDITFNEYWSTLVGINHSTIKSKVFGIDGNIQPPSYNKSKFTPTISVLYKPDDKTTLYTSYVEGLEKGETTPDDPKYNNPGALLSPFVSKQYEIGLKYNLFDQALLSAALFQIEKANSFEELTENGKYNFSQDGVQVHQGLELLLTGKLSNDLTIIGGGTFMSVEIDKSSDKSLESKKPTGVSEKMLKLYMEYSVPSIEGLILTGGMTYNSKQYINSSNTNELPSFILGDIGVRYKQQILNYPTTFNLNVANIADKDYWVNSSSIGAPRTIAFSIKTQF